MNASHEIERRPHAVWEVTSRRPKGVKIERLLSLAKRQQPLRVLEIGTGSGGIANYFGTHPELHCEVVAVDVHDNRVVTEGYQFIRALNSRSRTRASIWSSPIMSSSTWVIPRRSVSICRKFTES